MAFKKRNARRYAKKTKSARGIKKSSGVSSAVKSYVSKTLHASIENKCVQINAGNSFGNVLESPDFNAYPMCPLTSYWNIPQGVGQGSRVGNVIKTRKVYLNYILKPNQYDAATNIIPGPCDVQLMLGYVKNTPCFQPVPGDINQLFNSGSTVVAPVGTLRDIISVINTDYWVIKKRWTHKVGFSSANGTGALPQFQTFNNNDYKYNIIKKMDITKYIPKTHVFNDTSATTNTRNLFLMYYSVLASGGALTPVALPTNIEFWIDFHYEDA